MHEVRFYAKVSFQVCAFLTHDSRGFVVLADDDPVRIYAHSSSAALQPAIPVLQQPCTLVSAVPHAARMLQRQPAEQGHTGAGSQLPGLSDLLAVRPILYQTALRYVPSTSRRTFHRLRHVW